jgi:hypothetical protein
MSEPGDSPALSAPDLPFRLTGSQAKTAFALRANCEAMIAGIGQRELVPAKTVTVKNEAGQDVEKFIPAHFVCREPEFLNATAFLTLTVGSYVCSQHGKQKPGNEHREICPVCLQKMVFQQVFDAAEASRLINNLNRRVLKELFIRAIIVTERHKNRAIHFHLVGILRGCPDIRTGFDFRAFEQAKAARANGRVNHGAEVRYKLAASESLRGFWQMLREELPKYGFGRAELTPIIKTGEAVACYVSKYIEKNICNRLAEDKRKKLVRYIGDWKTVKAFQPDEREKLVALGVFPATKADYLQTMSGRSLARAGSRAPFKVRPNDFAWGSKRATAWRGKARQAAGLIACDSPEDCAAALGPRWAWHLSKTWQARTPDDLQPFLVADGWQLDAMREDLLAIVRRYRPGSLSNLVRARDSVASMKPEFLGGHHELMKLNLILDADETEPEVARFLEENLPLLTRKEGAIERFLRISARIDREETAWREFEANEKRREQAAMN